MSWDIYLCGNCGGPICFPNGEKMHVGTGWYCWKDEQSRSGPFAEIVEFWFDTNPSLLEGLVSRAIEHYTSWDARAPNPQKSPLIRHLRRQLAAGRADVIHGFRGRSSAHLRRSSAHLRKRKDCPP